MVEVFKTNIEDKTTAEDIIKYLSRFFPLSKINFDLEDCDNILRVESEYLIPEEIIKLLTFKGFYCEILE